MKSETLRLTFVSLVMVMAGMILAEGGASLGVVAARLELSSTQQGVLVATRFIGGIAMGLFLWLYGAEQIRIERALTISLFMVVGSAPLLLIESYGAALTVATARGLAVGIAIPMSGVYVGRQRLWAPGLISAITNSTLSGGLVAATVAASAFRAAGQADWRLYWSVALLPAGVAVVLRLVSALRAAHAQRGPAGAHTSALPRPGSRSLTTTVASTSWRYTLGAGLIVSGEAVLFGYLPFLTATRIGRPDGGEQFALLLMAGVLAGRLISIPLSKRFRSTRLFGAHVAMTVAALAAWALAPPVLLAPAVMLAGIGASAVFPGLVAIASERLRNGSGTTIASTGWAGGVGGTIAPMLAGVALEAGVMASVVGGSIALPALLGGIIVSYGRHRTREGHLPRQL